MAATNGTRAGVIGLGAMGLGMATSLPGRFTVAGFDPADPARTRATDAGVTTVETTDASLRMQM